MLRIWLILPIITLKMQCILSGRIDGSPNFVDQDALLTRALLGPPNNSSFFRYKNLCGLSNPCETPDSVGCELGEKKKRTKRDTFQGEDYIKLGKSVPKFKYPWMALLAVKEKEGWLFWEEIKHLFLCSASLISMRHVVTARHCLTGRWWNAVTGLDIFRAWNIRRAPKHDKLYVLLGADRVGESEDIAGPFTFEAESKVLEMMIPHRTNPSHDFAVLRIEDVLFTDKIRPICLPIDGIPLGGHYFQAGFGYKGAYFDDTGARRQNFPDALQEVNDVYLDAVSVNPKDTKRFPHMGGELLPQHRIEPIDKTLPHNGTGVTATFIISSADGRVPCSGDSGGPVMWRNPNTGIYFLVGVHRGKIRGPGATCGPSDNHIIRSRASKVSYWMEYIYRIMRPFSHANKVCLPEECKQNSDVTWIQRNLVLNAPCGTPDDVDGFLCLKREGEVVLTDRTRISNTKEFYLKHGYSECVSCPAGSNPNWNYSYWAEQITLGSFSRPRYYGVQSPFHVLKEYFEDILPNEPDDACVNYEYGGINCLAPNGGKGACISSADLCDGKDDCLNAWDENPNLCVGKCDYWTLNEDSTKYWQCDGCKPKNLTARACYETCHKKINCKWHQWEENGNCNHFNSDEITAPDLFKSHSRTIRGPARCPAIPLQIIVCRPILAPPYRNGAFRIQTFSGRFLQLNIVGRKKKLNLVALEHENLMDPIPDGDANNVNATEWLIQFHGTRQLADSFSTIRTGIIYNNPPKYITVRYPDHANETGPDGGYVFMYEKLNDNFHDPVNNLDQRIYIRPVYEFPRDMEPKDMMDMAMYTKYTDPASNTVKIVRLFSEPGDAEYDHDRTGHYVPDNLKLNAAGPAHSQDGLKVNQREGRFRFKECEYILPEKKGIQPLPDKYKKPDHFFQDCETSPFSMPSLHNYFGMSYDRLWNTTKITTIHKLICNALEDSHTIWDYAGRMRLSTDDFRRMYHHLERFDNITSLASKEVLKYVKDYFLENIPEYYKLLDSQ